MGVDDNLRDVAHSEVPRSRTAAHGAISDSHRFTCMKSEQATHMWLSDLSLPRVEPAECGQPTAREGAGRPPQVNTQDRIQASQTEDFSGDSSIIFN